MLAPDFRASDPFSDPHPLPPDWRDVNKEGVCEHQQGVGRSVGQCRRRRVAVLTTRGLHRREGRWLRWLGRA